MRCDLLDAKVVKHGIILSGDCKFITTLGLQEMIMCHSIKYALIQLLIKSLQSEKVRPTDYMGAYWPSPPLYKFVKSRAEI